MIGRVKRPNPCNNLNHRRSNAPVGYCPQCGGVVNPDIRAEACDEDKHATARRRQSVFCIHCGLQLIVTR